MLWMIGLTVAALAVTTMIHYEVIVGISDRFGRNGHRMRRILPVALSVLVATHLLEIGAYAGAFWLARDVLRIGLLNGSGPIGFAEIFYFAAETYTSLGYGDIIPVGDIRLLASIEPVDGLLLLAWSGALLYEAVHATRPLARGAAEAEDAGEQPRAAPADAPLPAAQEARQAAPDLPFPADVLEPARPRRRASLVN
ncbi:potassium channel family protein [Jiella sonneratiae]|uniref:Two pore domain potassium channel family protein n=1 Tax=Jiella sonneratiae TaxID=2816856 RepID=A0ABS3J9L4_9HYPH|nr:potassium channel family protein [Jiella sonneratiae]MBO0905812.1 two pore domain potassium channel family protein [Jiella sonneratiae]